ncbi:hypothetical protein [Microbacterium sp. NPDC058389]|uniref:hypothetical protein n=1 Tax=Microbacterium sp. NPDC058389 TaxID=3346475 RepID=UPI003664E994
MDAAMLAGTVSTVLFAAANLPMLVKAVRSHDLRSYSASALIMGNLGNLVYTFYVVSLPFGPIWVLHGFYLVTMALMLVLYAVSARARRVRDSGESSPSVPAVPRESGGVGAGRTRIS